MAKLEAAAADRRAAEEGARLRAEEDKQPRIAAEEGVRLRAEEEKQAAARLYEAEVNLQEQELRLLRERERETGRRRTR